jgi:hypothetical protein
MASFRSAAKHARLHFVRNIRPREHAFSVAQRVDCFRSGTRLINFVDAELFFQNLVDINLVFERHGRHAATVEVPRQRQRSRHGFVLFRISRQLDHDSQSDSLSTFSFTRSSAAALPANICTFDSGEVKLGNELVGIIERHNFKVNPAKTRMSSRRHRMEVTGIVINDFPNVKRLFIDRVRGALHAWEKYGYDAAQAQWAEHVHKGMSLAYEKRPWKRQTRTRKPPELKNVVWGKLLYIRIVRGANDVIYTRLAERYNRLTQAEGAAK